MGRKRKKEVSSSDDSDDEKIELMKRICDHFRGQITALNNSLLTVADVSIPKARNEAILSWRKKNPELISVNAIQKSDDCWAHAFARGLYAVMKQHGYNSVFPTADSLVRNIEKKFLTATQGLPKTRDAAPSLLKQYGCTLVVHRRPKLSLAKENDDFEKFIERRLAIAPVAMCFEYVPGYPRFKHKKYDVFRPSSIDLEAMRYESFDAHCALITGRGVVLKGGESVEFWEIHETRGGNLGDKGFTRIERHKRIVTEVYEFQFDRGQATTSSGSKKRVKC